jgi:hypothetical protein
VTLQVPPPTPIKLLVRAINQLVHRSSRRSPLVPRGHKKLRSLRVYRVDTGRIGENVRRGGSRGSSGAAFHPVEIARGDSGGLKGRVFRDHA